MNRPLFFIALLSLLMTGCSYFMQNDEQAYLKQNVKSTPDLVLPEGAVRPKSQAYMPLPEGATEYPATHEELDFKPPVDEAF